MLERTLLWTIRAGFVLLLLTPFIVSRSFFFPFITGKNFYFRIIVELMLGAWGALALLNPAFRPRVSPLFAAIAAFVAALTLATAFGVYPYRSFWSNFERMEGLVTQLHFLALFLVLAHSVKTRREWGIFLIISLVLSMHPALHGLLQYADSTNDILQKSKTLQGLGFDPIIGASRPYARFGNSIYLAVYLMFHLFFLAVVFAGSKLPWARILVGAAFLFELFVFFQAASRGAFLGFIVGVGLAGILAAIFSRSRAYRIAGFSAVGLVVALALLLLFAPYNFLIQRSELLGRFSSAIHSGIGDDPRIMIWGIAVDAFKARPLFGWGPENFTIPYAKFYNPNLFGNEPWFDRAHNIFLEWLVAGGIIGFVAYIAIFVCALWMLARVARVRIQARFEMILMAGLVVAYMVQNIFVFDNVMTYVMTAALFAYIHSYAISADNSVSKRYVPRATNFALAALSVVASLVLAYALNAKPIRAAGGIIAGMESFKTADPNVIKKAFDDTIQLNTFGTTEARERIADTMVQIATNIDST
ncbi:MAG: O-antigen ligase family protein, partial [Candidatus Ryanbacteria bacterium]|nr:O-antigen ligase family protein [Candidatus Ryanbacteria bacterium]